MLAACVLKGSKYDVEMHEARKQFMTRKQALAIAPDVLQNLTDMFPELVYSILGVAYGANVSTLNPVTPKCVVNQLLPLYKYITAPVHKLQWALLYHCRRFGKRFVLRVPSKVGRKEVEAWARDPSVKFVVAASGGREGAIHELIAARRRKYQSLVQESDMLQLGRNRKRTYGVACTVTFSNKIIGFSDRTAVEKASRMDVTTPRQRQFVTRDNYMYMGQLITPSTHKALQPLLRMAHAKTLTKERQPIYRELIREIFGDQLSLLSVDPAVQLRSIHSVAVCDVAIRHHTKFATTVNGTTFLLMGGAAFPAHFVSGQGANSGMRSAGWFMKAFMDGRHSNRQYEAAVRNEMAPRLRIVRNALYRASFD